MSHLALSHASFPFHRQVIAAYSFYMESTLSPCDPNDTLEALAASVEVLLCGVRRDHGAVLPQFAASEARETAWKAFVEETLGPVQKTIYQAYEAAVANRLEDILDIHPGIELPKSAQELTQAILLTSKGARHERLLSRLAEAPSPPSHPCVALAAKAAAFNEPLVAAQVAYFFQEWQASGTNFETATLSAFLESQPETLLSISPATLLDPQSPFLKAASQQDQQHHG